MKQNNVDVPAFYLREVKRVLPYKKINNLTYFSNKQPVTKLKRCCFVGRLIGQCGDYSIPSKKRPGEQIPDPNLPKTQNYLTLAHFLYNGNILSDLSSIAFRDISKPKYKRIKNGIITHMTNQWKNKKHLRF